MWQSLWVPESSTLYKINISQAFYKWRFCANIHTISERKFETKNESKALLWHWEVNEIIFILNLRTLFEFRKVVGLFKFSNCLAVLPVDIVQQRQKTREREHPATWNEWNCGIADERSILIHSTWNYFRHSCLRGTKQHPFHYSPWQLHHVPPRE